MDTYVDDSSIVISFRIKQGLAQSLSRKAAKEQLSLNLYVRNVFLDAIAQTDLRSDISDLGRRIESLHQEVASLPSTIFQLWEDQEEREEWEEE